MKKIVLLFLVFINAYSFAQTALYNEGNLQIHENGQMGFHTNLINNGSFDENLGLAGFYSELPLSVSGVFPITFFNLEVLNGDTVSLDTSLNVSNDASFFTGDFFTNRTQTDNYLNFLDDATSTGSSDMTKVDGYVGISNKQRFTFPIGDELQLRPLVLTSEAENIFAKSAYFLEDINSPVTFSTSFDTSTKESTLGSISTVEFWRLEGSIASTIQISWNERSNISAFAGLIETLSIVGWEKSSNQWVNIGSTGATGDLNEGFITSSSFIPDNYEVITFGSSTSDREGELSSFVKTDNFLVTPNGDGVNDNLVFPETDLSPNNSVQIFDRYGLKVFEQDDYTNEFNGYSTAGSFVISKDKGLPSGVYFYIIYLEDIDLDFQGFLYLSNE